MAQRIKQSTFIYALEEPLDTEALLLGLNAFAADRSDGVDYHNALVVGRQGRRPLTETTPVRLLLVSRHKQTGVLGVLWQDFGHGLLREMEETGKQLREKEASIG